jgi:hypothetical protein
MRILLGLLGLGLILGGSIGLVVVWRQWRKATAGPEMAQWTTAGIELRGHHRSNRMAPEGFPGHGIHRLQLDAVPSTALEPPYELLIPCTTRPRKATVLFLRNESDHQAPRIHPESEVTGGDVEYGPHSVTIRFSRPLLKPPAMVRVSIMALEPFEAGPIWRRPTPPPAAPRSPKPK